MSGPTLVTDEVRFAAESLRSGRPVLVLDDESRENEGDVVLAASHASPEWIGWTVRHTSGVLCAPMPATTADRLGLPPMVIDNQDPRRTAYTVSVDARFGIGTGISAADRARTLQVLAGASTTPHDLVRPGHVFPLRAVDGGVLARAGHTEAAVDLCRLAGLPPVGVIAELVTDAGPTMGRPEVLALGAAHDLPTITIADLARHLREYGYPGDPGAAPAAVAPAEVVRTSEALLPTGLGTFRVLGFRDRVTGREHLAALAGDPQAPRAVVRVHSECLTGDVLGSTRCDCGPQLRGSLAAVGRDGGVVIYLRGHEGRGIGLLDKLAAYALQDQGLDTVDANTALDLPADGRSYAAAAAILRDLDLDHIRLLTNNPAKIAGLARHGITVTERVPLIAPDTEESRAYVSTKRARMGHEIPVVTA